MEEYLRRFENAVKDGVIYYYHAGLNHEMLPRFPQFTINTTKENEALMAEKAILQIASENKEPLNSTVLTLSKLTQNIFFDAYRTGWGKKREAV